MTERVQGTRWFRIKRRKREIGEVATEKPLESGLISSQPGLEVGRRDSPVVAWKTVRQEEDFRIRERREKCGFPPDVADRVVEKDGVGLALSGGGIRSATFNLGILQAMERYGPLRPRKNGDESGEEKPVAMARPGADEMNAPASGEPERAAAPEPEEDIEYSLLEKVDYLSTVSGGGYIGSCLTWFMSGREVAGQGQDGQDGAHFPFGTTRLDTYSAGGRDPLPYKVVRWLRRHGEYLRPGEGLNTWALAGTVLRGILLNLLVFGTIFFAIVSALRGVPVPKARGWLRENLWEKLLGLVPERAAEAPADELFYVFLALAGLLLLVLGASFFLSGLLSSFRFSRLTSPFGLRGWLNKLTGRLLQAAVYALVLGSVPVVSALVQASWKQATASISLSGVLSLAAGWLWGDRDGKRLGRFGAFIPLGLALLLYGLLLVLYRAAAHSSAKEIGILVALVLPIVILANVNHISLHRFYRDRLMEAYMPDFGTGERKGWKPDFTAADGFLLKDIKPSSAPYHLVNTNLVTVDSADPELRARGGDSFIFSPLFCGCPATDYARTQSYMGGDTDLATAFAISGAAVQPNTGATRSRPLAILMTLLNVRMGYWIRNPKLTRIRWRPVGGIYWFSYIYVLGEMLGRGLNEDRRFVHLSDGGHFENLGLYELVRRRCKYIIVCDAAADPDWTFGDLARVCKLVRVDFGAKIEIDTRPIHPRSEPGKLLLSKRPFVHGTIEYLDGFTSKLLFIKTCLVAGLPEDIYSYHRLNKRFPDQTTADQFFDEQQFEAYRELGFRIGQQAFGKRVQGAPAERYLERVFSPDEDDLSEVEGVGPKISGLLKDAGIDTFARLAKAPIDRLEGILAAAGLHAHDPATWPEQAALAAAGRWPELDELRDRLMGGRRVSEPAASPSAEP